MNDRPEPARDESDWLDAILRAEGREHRAGYVDDNGFTARVMSSLPPPVTLPAWRKPAVTAIWAGAGIGIAALLPSAFIDFTHEIVRMIVGQPVSMTGMAAGVVALGAVTWGATALVLRDDSFLTES